MGWDLEQTRIGYDQDVLVDGMSCFVDYNIMARPGHAVTSDEHINWLTLAMYLNTFIKMASDVATEVLAERWRRPMRYYSMIKEENSMCLALGA